VRHGIDTSKIQFSCQGKSLLLTGALFKDGGNEVEAKAIEAIVQELSRIGVKVNSELENWNICEGSISKKGTAQSDSANQASKGELKKAPLQIIQKSNN
jgi:ABC-type transport system substrate-binding protein